MILPLPYIYFKTLGEKYDDKLCFESRDAHFDCLDRFNEIKG